MVDDPRAMTKKARRSHTKSRTGCLECKKQHSKCDESRPSCINCSTANRRCSYLDENVEGLRPAPASVHRTPGTASASPGTTTPNTGLAWTPGSSAEGLSTPSYADDGSQNTDPALRMPPSSFLPLFTHNVEFGIGHLVLLHHLETVVVRIPGCDNDAMASGIKFAMQVAAEHPYLLNQLLAISALHMSITQTTLAAQAHYHDEATRLQTRALSQFDPAHETADGYGLTAMSLFSGTVGFHVLCDAMVCGNGDFPQFLEKFLNYMSLNRGTRAIVGKAWLPLHVGPMGALFEQATAALFAPFEGPVAIGAECDDLLHLLESADLGPSSAEGCREATKMLKQMYRVVYEARREGNTGRTVHATIAWCSLVPGEYVKALDQRRPEALVVLAYWAMLVHQSRDFWAFDGGGKFLIESIRAHLGGYWERWMEWPLRAVNGTWNWS